MYQISKLIYKNDVTFVKNVYINLAPIRVLSYERIFNFEVEDII